MKETVNHEVNAPQSTASSEFMREASMLEKALWASTRVFVAVSPWIIVTARYHRHKTWLSPTYRSPPPDRGRILLVILSTPRTAAHVTVAESTSILRRGNCAQE